jgi:hypothetical protein
MFYETRGVTLTSRLETYVASTIQTSIDRDDDDDGSDDEFLQTINLSDDDEDGLNNVVDVEAQRPGGTPHQRLDAANNNAQLPSPSSSSLSSSTAPTNGKERRVRRSRLRAFLTSLPAFVVSFIGFPMSVAASTCGAVCVPAYTAALGSIFGVVVDSLWLEIGMLFVSLLSIAWSCYKARRGYRPLLIGCVGAAVVVAGKAYKHNWTSLIGNVVLVAAALINVWPSLMGREQVCEYVPKAKRKQQWSKRCIDAFQACARRVKRRLRTVVRGNIRHHMGREKFG